MRNAVTTAFIFLIVSLATTAGAATGSVSTALDIVNGFYAEAAALVDTVDGAHGPFKELTLGEKEKTLSDLRTIGISKGPSRERYEQVREIAESYMNGVISHVEQLKTGPAEKHGPRIDDIAAQLSALKSFKLRTLEDTLQIESYEKKSPKRVPLMDERTPFDRPPDEPPGIWFR